LTHRATTAALLLPSLALAGTVSACGADRVDRKDLESKIADQIKRQTDVSASVDCPRDVSPKQGTTAHCTTVLSGATVDITVTFTHDGRFTLTSVRPRVG
jgi:Domain of unknown function (DUF4333)